MSQSKTSSFIESWINVLIGFGINFTANALVLPLIGFHISMAQNLTLGVIYTAISVARSYVIRRWFNARIHRAAEQLSKTGSNP